MKLTQRQLKEIFDYREDGFLVWRKPPTNRVRRGQLAGSLRADGRLQISVLGKLHLAYRLIFLWHHGFIPDAIDHINRDRSDNRISNLRDSRGMNNANRTKSQRKSSSFRGVSWSSYHGKWQAACGERFIGRFDSECEAAKAYDKRARELYAEFAHPNFS